MAGYANIISFSDVKAASQRRHAQQDSSARATRTSRAPRASERTSRDPENAFVATSVRYNLATFASNPNRELEDAEALVQGRSGSGASRTRTTARSGRTLFAKKPAQELIDETPAEDAPARAAAAAAEDGSRASRRRERSKARAEKLFSKQYAEQPHGSEPAEGAPRAALYEGHMGTSQRKAARMQRASEAGSSMAKLNPAGWFAGLSIKPSRLHAVTAVLCLVLAAVFLYTPAQHYYQAVREHDRLNAEYTSIAERNEALNAQNASLSSDAGMEDAVRQKYGYIIEGEETAVVSGLSEDAANRHGDGVEANVLSSSVKAPEEWYTPYLDAFFGVA